MHLAPTTPLPEFDQREVRPGLECVVRTDRLVAEFIAARMGDHVDPNADCITIGFVAGDPAVSFAVVLHSRDTAGRVWMSASDAFVPWITAVPRTIAAVAFGQLGASAILMRAVAHDVERAVVASRFGFSLVDFDGEHVTLRLGREHLRPALSRQLRRHMH